MRTKLKNGEEVAVVIRPHWLVLGWAGLFSVFGILCGTILANFGFILGLLIPLIPLLYLGYLVVLRNNNIWVVTNLRVIDESGFFSHNSKESPLDKINNVTYDQSIWGRIFGFGNVQIQTAAEIGATTYFMVERPKILQDRITHMQEEYKRSQILFQARELAKAVSAGQPQTKTDVADEVEKLFALKQKGILSEEEYQQRKRKILDS